MSSSLEINEEIVMKNSLILLQTNKNCNMTKPVEEKKEESYLDQITHKKLDHEEDHNESGKESEEFGNIEEGIQKNEEIVYNKNNISDKDNHKKIKENIELNSPSVEKNALDKNEVNSSEIYENPKLVENLQGMTNLKDNSNDPL